MPPPSQFNIGEHHAGSHDSFKLDLGVKRQHSKQASSALASLTAPPIWVAAPDAGAVPRVKVFDAATGRLAFSFLAYPRSFRGGVRVAVGDVDGDGTPDIITGAGPGGGSQVGVFDGKSGEALAGALGGFDAFAPGESNGIFVAAGDVDGDGHADVIVGSDGATPAVKVFSGTDGSLLASYTLAGLAPGGGARVAAGDVDGDGRAELIVGGGPGGPPRVLVLDAATGAEVYDFFAFDPEDTGGIYVGAGDVDGDGKADILAGQGAGSWLRVFSGADTTPLRSVQAFDPDFTGGVRVAAVDADGDGKLDILAGAGPAGGQARLFDAVTGEQVHSKTPFSANTGLFVGGDPRPGDGGIRPLTSNPVVTVQATTPDTVEGGAGGVFTFTRSDTTGTLEVFFSLSGTATSTTDYTLSGNSQSNSVVFAAGSTTKTLTINPVDDTRYEDLETVVLTIQTNASYDLGNPSSAVVVLRDNDSPERTVPEAIVSAGDLVAAEPGAGGNNPLAASSHGVNYFDGVLAESDTDLASFGFGVDWGLSHAWTNASANDAAGYDGNNIVLAQVPYLRQDSNTNAVAVIGSGATARIFDYSGGSYSPRFFLHETLTHDTTAKKFILTDSAGRTLRFFDFDASYPTYKQGLLDSQTDPDGNVTSVTQFTSDGKPLEVQRSDSTGGVTTTESYLYSYLSSGVNSGKIDSVTLRRQVNGGSWTTVRKLENTYYDGTESYGNLGDLKLAVIKDAAGNTLDTRYYRYYTSASSTGYVGALKYVFGHEAYGRLTAVYSNPSSATDAQVAPYADRYLEYDALKRVTKQTVQGEGCSACSGGLGTFTFSYTVSSFADGVNNWRVKAVETLPDGTQNIVFTNYAGQVLLKVFKDATNATWATFYKYDSSGRVVLIAQPSAVSGYDETRPDLLNNQSGNYGYLRDSSGLVETISYYTSTTAGETTAGGVAGYQYQTSLQRGETGTAVLQSTTTYFAHTGGGITVHPIAEQTVYRNSDGTGAETTSHSYTWFTSTAQVESETVTRPTVTSGQNGPGTADTETVFYDVYGRPVWRKDGDGFIHYTAYDQATGAVVKTITDVDTSHTSDFTNLPSGWSTPSGGGLHLITTYEVDSLGRPTKTTDPNGNVTYTVYNDANHEVRIYRGWNTSTNAPTGPTEVYREDRAGGYTETLTMSATPTVDGSGRPTGAESIGSLQTLSRSYTNSAGQVTYTDRYFNLSGLTYSTSTSLGTENTHFYRTRFGYDDRGRLERVQLPTGTIERTVFDALGRVSSEWVGTNDTPTSGEWSPTNNGSPCNMVKVREHVYDGGAVGDGNRTQTTEYPGGGSANRVTQTFFDWRDRPVATKAGVEGTESTSTNRPIVYREYDNLGEAIASEVYDGDQVSIADANSDGVPDRPSSSLLRAKQTASFDEQGRVYHTDVYSVDPSTGSVSTASLKTDAWYDHRGEVIKTAQPGGQVSKEKYDGAGRVVKVYTTDGGGDSSWSDAGSVTGDVVLEQQETTYDSVGNATLSVARLRFHDETATGELGNASTAPKARVTYAAAYFDKANRLTDTVDVGSNGGSSYSRPSSVPSRSDTVLVTSWAYNAGGWVDTITDPRGLVTKQYQDNLGRTTKTIEAYTDGIVSDTDDKTTEYSYDGSGHVLTVKAYLTGGGYQTTEMVYGVSPSDGSNVYSNDILRATKYPDPSTGNASSSEQQTQSVNAVGEVISYSDRNGNTHQLSFDVLGRLKADAVTTLGSGVSGVVRRIEIDYDTQGNAATFTSFDAATGGNVVNQVKREFNGLRQLVREYQSHSGAVNTSTTPKVEYAFSEMASGANHSRPTSITYPNGKVVNFNYASGLDSNISRLSSISDSTGTLESYDYLGLGMVVRRAHSQPGVDLTYIKQSGESNGDAGDQYTGLDRFGRVVDQRWLKTSSGTATDRFKYGYDRDSDRQYRENLIDATFSELYHANGASAGYDPLNQLSDFRRGTLSDANSDGVPDTVSAASRSQAWDVDALGNFDSVTTNGTAQTRGHNKQNEITSVSGATTPTYDANGNLTKDETGKQYVYDAWNRLVFVKDASGNILVSYSYDALGRRISETPTGGSTRDFYFSAAWQVLEERVGGTARVQYVWSPVYVDALVLRDRDADSNGSLEERLWVQQDANGNVTALVDGTGAVVERYVYDPYGTVTVLTPSWGSRASSSYGWVYLHQGGRFDTASGLYEFRFRWYSPTLARWLQLDPVGVAGGASNLYGYVDNSPVSLLDPFGLMADTPDINQIPETLRNLGNWTWNAEERRFELLIESEHVEGGRLTFHVDKPHGNLPAHGDLQGLLVDGQRKKVRISTAGEILISKGPATAGGDFQGTLKKLGVDAKSRRIGRSGNISPSAAFALGASAISTAAATYGYQQYVDEGWEIGDRLATRVGLGRALQILGMMGELPEEDFTYTKWDGTVIHVSVVEGPDGQRYFKAWHKETRRGGFLWLFTREETVEDIAVGDVPAYHVPSTHNVLYAPEDVDLSKTSLGWGPGYQPRPVNAGPVPGTWIYRPYGG